MQKGNTLFYHSHILSNIDKLDLRKNSYLGHRLEFLDQLCEPIKRKIDHIKDDIKYYENMRDTQYEVIENQPDIMALKKQIKDYQATKSYFQAKLDDYDQLVTQIQETNSQLKGTLAEKHEEYKLVNMGVGAKSLASISHHQIKGLQRQKSILSSTIGMEDGDLSQLHSLVRERTEAEDNDHKLPKIKQIQPKRQIFKYFVHNQNRIISQHRANERNRTSLIEKNASISEIGNEEKVELTQAEMKMLISQFDKTQSLFRECFERKKVSIQKSVSQLQSRLITNKEIFLKACQVIGQKEGKIPIEDFMELTSDELITLFISFSWLNRKIYGDLMRKRKDIVSLLRKMKNSELSTQFSST